MRLAAFTENLSLKLFSLAVSVLLFLFVSVESATPVDVDFHVEYRVQEDIQVVGTPPQVVQATLQGPWASFRSFDPSDLKPVVVDLTGAGPGSVRHVLETSDISPPGGMMVKNIRPTEISVTLDRKVERMVPVQVDVAGQPPRGYALEFVSAEPQKVRVTGPSSEMQRLDYIYTKRVDLDGRDEDFSLEVDLQVPTSPLRLKDKRVKITVQISEEIITRSFEDLPVAADGAPQGTKLVPERVSLKLKGPRPLVDNLDADTLEAYVEAQPEYDDGEQAFEKAVKLRGQPERTQWVGTAPRVQVLIPKSKVKRPKKK